MLVILCAIAGIVFVILGLVHVIGVAVGLGLGVIAILTIQLLAGIPTARRDLP